jgi:hypothetical protein
MQESYRVGEHVTVRKKGREHLSKPDSGSTHHSEKGEEPKHMSHEEFAQNSGSQNPDESYRAGQETKLRHAKPDQDCPM